MILLVPTLAFARTWTVDTGGAGDTTSLQAAIDAATAGDTIQLNAGTFTGPYTWTGKDLTIAGAGSDRTVLAGPGYGAVVSASELSAASSLSGVAFQNVGGTAVSASNVSATFSDILASDLGSESAYGGAFYFYGGSPRVVDSSFDANLAIHGGAIYADTTTSLTLTGTTFVNNEATEGGAILLGGSAALVIDACTFSSNLASGSGGAIETGSYAVLQVSASTFDGNGADVYYGGAIYAYYGTSVTLSGVTVSSNSSGYHGGAVYLGTAATFVDTGSTWEDNVAYSYGGDLFAESTNTLDISGSTFTDGISTYGYGGSIYAQYATRVSASSTTWNTPYGYYSGGALYLYVVYETVTLADVSFTGALSLYGGGGAIYATNAQLVLDRAVFTQNESGGGGGALALYSYVGLTLRDSELSGNIAVTGGAIAYDSYTTGYGGMTVTDSTFTTNVATYEGGAVSSGSGDRLELQRNTFAHNIAGPESYGGAVQADGLPLVLARNNLFSRNSAGIGGAVYNADNYGDADTWQNNVFVENSSTIGGAGCWVQNGTSKIENNTFVGNAAAEVGGVLCLVENPVTLRNNLFGWTNGGEVLYAYDDASVQGTDQSFNALWNNAGDAAGGSFGPDAFQGSVTEDPLVVAYSSDNDASNDSLVLQASSPLVDAGSPDLLDPDGTPSDIGAFGGPYAWTDDADADGVDRLSDCNDADATVFPGAPETWYDGVDQDCDGNDDDKDGDGLGRDEDCDDKDAAIGACAKDSGTPDGGGGEGCGCQGAPGALPLGLLALLMVRRRR